MTTETETTVVVLSPEAQLKALLAQFSAADVKKLLKAAEADKPTLLSLTMDAIVAHEAKADMVTDNVARTVTASGLAAGVLKAGESATQSSVGALIRYAAAYNAALVRAGYETVKKAAAEPTSTPEPDKAPEPVPPASGTPAPAYEVRKPDDKTAPKGGRG